MDPIHTRLFLTTALMVSLMLAAQIVAQTGELVALP